MKTQPSNVPGAGDPKPVPRPGLSVRARSKQALVHELQVHQIELEQQNEELRAVQRDLAAAHDRYVDLFEHAPVGYLTLDPAGRITVANLTAATELRVDRHAMLRLHFQHFIAPADCDRWLRLQALVLRDGEPQRIEARLRRDDGQLFHAQLDCVRMHQPAATAQLRVTITDISQHALAERNRRIAVSASRAREAERRRVALGLHEDLGQRLCALKLALSAVQVPGPPSQKAAVAAMAEQLDEALAVVRRMSSGLHPLILENLGLNAAMHWLVNDVAVRLGLDLELRMDEEVPVDPALAIAIYRLAEAVLEQVSRRVTAGVCMDVLRRPQDLVLQFHCEHGHVRPDAPAGGMEDLPESLMDQLHLLGGRVEVDKPSPGMCHISLFVPLPRPSAA